MLDVQNHFLWSFHFASLILQVKLRAMKSHDDRVEKLNERVKELMENPNIPKKLQEDLEEFNKRWGNTFEKIGEYSIIDNAFNISISSV